MNDYELDHVWEIFQYIKDVDSPGIVEAAVYFHNMHHFDIECLPPKLYDAVILELKMQALERHANDLASDIE